MARLDDARESQRPLAQPPPQSARPGFRAGAEEPLSLGPRLANASVGQGAWPSARAPPLGAGPIREPATSPRRPPVGTHLPRRFPGLRAPAPRRRRTDEMTIVVSRVFAPPLSFPRRRESKLVVAPST